MQGNSLPGFHDIIRHPVLGSPYWCYVVVIPYVFNLDDYPPVLSVFLASHIFPPLLVCFQHPPSLPIVDTETDLASNMHPRLTHTLTQRVHFAHSRGLFLPDLQETRVQPCYRTKTIQ